MLRDHRFFPIKFNKIGRWRTEHRSASNLNKAAAVTDFWILYWGWKLNNLTSLIHYSLGVSSKYSLFFSSLAVYSHSTVMAVVFRPIWLTTLRWPNGSIIPDFPNQNTHNLLIFVYLIPLFIIQYSASTSDSTDTHWWHMYHEVLIIAPLVLNSNSPLTVWKWNQHESGRKC